MSESCEKEKCLDFVKQMADACEQGTKNLINAYELYNHYDHNIGVCLRDGCERCNECYRFNSYLEWKDLKRYFPIDEYLFRLGDGKDPYNFSEQVPYIKYMANPKDCPHFIKDEIKDDELTERRRKIRFTGSIIGMWI